MLSRLTTNRPSPMEAPHNGELPVQEARAGTHETTPAAVSAPLEALRERASRLDIEREGQALFGTPPPSAESKVNVAVPLARTALKRQASNADLANSLRAGDPSVQDPLAAIDPSHVDAFVQAFDAASHLLEPFNRASTAQKLSPELLREQRDAMAELRSSFRRPRFKDVLAGQSNPLPFRTLRAGIVSETYAATGSRVQQCGEAALLAIHHLQRAGVPPQHLLAIQAATQQRDHVVVVYSSKPFEHKGGVNAQGEQPTLRAENFPCVVVDTWINGSDPKSSSTPKMRLTNSWAELTQDLERRLDQVVPNRSPDDVDTRPSPLRLQVC